MPKVNIERIESDVMAIARFGLQEGGRGVYRQGFSKADMAARKWLGDTFEELGMTHWMDGAGNVIGRFGPADKPAIQIGSHVDSVPAGGIFDGVLGVVAGLEVVRSMQEAGISAMAPATWLHEEDSDELKASEEAAEAQATEEAALQQVQQGADIAKTANEAGLLQ